MIFKNQTFWTLFLAGALILVMGSLRPDKPRGMHSMHYDIHRSRWSQCGDVVLAGDSRVLIALSPEEMGKVLKDRRILNYSYAGVWYSKEYLEAVGAILDPNGDSPTVVLGISPRSLTQGVRDNPGAFTGSDNTMDKDALIEYAFAPILEFCQPMSFNQVLPGISPSLASSILIKEYHADGWMSANCTVNKRGKWAIKRYRRVYDKYDVLNSTIENVMKHTKSWVDNGVKVYGFFPPSCEEMVEIEAGLESFDQADFISRFEEFGGVWLDVNQVGYESYDGCHLNRDGALQFSSDLGKIISEHERQ